MRSLGHDIYVIDNFFSHHNELKKNVISYCQTAEHYSIVDYVTKLDKSITDQSYYVVIEKKQSILCDLLVELLNKIHLLICDVYKENLISQWENKNILCTVGYHPNGCSSPLHVDHGASEEYPYKYSSVYYLNRSYEDGNLYFPDLNIDVEVLENQLVLMPSAYLHGSTKVKNGEKYLIPMFYKGKINGN